MKFVASKVILRCRPGETKMLIIDRFSNEEKAREFMAAIAKELGLTAHFARSEDGYLSGENQKINEEAPMRGALTCSWSSYLKPSRIQVCLR